jgi:hypothetical protein
VLNSFLFFMSVRYVIDKERRLVITSGSDRVTFAEAKAHQDQLLSDPDFNPEFDQLIDMTAVTDLDVSVDEIRMLVTREVFSQTSRRAWVAADPMIFGVGRMMAAYYKMWHESSEVWVFYDVRPALEWLRTGNAA